MNNAHLPIGIFDSGVGGLTVVRAIRRALPHEDIVYLGDTARVPYGTKSPSTVVRFSCEDTQFLMHQRVKAVIVGCSTVSAWALPALEYRFNVPLIDVILPGVRAALAQTRNQRIGIIATNSTVRSMAYNRALIAECPTARVFAQACPLLVPLVEEGWIHHPVTDLMLRDYLRPLRRHRIDTLILACTHFPLLRKAIRRVLGESVELVDCAATCAQFARERLAALHLLNPQRRRHGRLQAYVTDEPERFTLVAHRFLGVRIEPALQVELAPTDPGLLPPATART
jgi:glutamate racemase